MAPVSRRDFLAASSLAASSLVLQPTAAAQATPEATTSRPLRVAAINSIYRLRSHAYHLCGRVIHGYTKDGLHHQPALKLVRMLNDQTPKDDLGREYGKRYGVELCDSVAATLGGAKTLDVDAVMLIIEHGDYPVNARGQVLYPRYDKFREIVDVFQASGKTVPVFIDKHLSFDHRNAAEMIQLSRKLGFPMMAGSSLPVTWRIPEIDPPRETPFTEGLVTFGFDRGSVDIYLFHALESLQCLLERRRGGETGVKSVQCLKGEAVWQAARAGRWSERLMQAALKHCPSQNVGSVRENVSDPLAVLIEYHDGTRGTILNLIEQTSEFGFAGTIDGREEPLAACLFLPAPPAANFFNPLIWHIEQFFLSGKPTYPVERTWLTTTMCDLALQSLQEGSRVVTAPALDIRYQPPVWGGFFRGSTANGL